MSDAERLWEALAERDHKRAHAAFLELEELASQDPAVYGRFDELVGMLGADSSYARTRGFLLIVACAVHDEEGRIEAAAFDRMEELLHDAKPTAVRQCVQALPRLVETKPNMADRVTAALESVDPGAYRDSMAPLVAADVARALEEIRRQGEGGREDGR